MTKPVAGSRRSRSRSKPPAISASPSPPLQRTPSLEQLSSPTELDDLKFLWRGRGGEEVVLKKADAMDTASIPCSILTACCVAALLDLRTGDFGSHAQPLALHVYAILFSLTSALGFNSLLLFTMVSAKIKRLTGRSLYRFGDRNDNMVVIKAFHGVKWEKKKKDCLVKDDIHRHSPDVVRFSAREWYYHCHHTKSSWLLRFCCPANASSFSFHSFWCECVFFSIGLAIKVFFTLSSLRPEGVTQGGSTGTQAAALSVDTTLSGYMDSTLTGYICAFLLIAGFMVPLGIAAKNGAMNELA